MFKINLYIISYTNRVSSTNSKKYEHYLHNILDYKILEHKAKGDDYE